MQFLQRLYKDGLKDKHTNSRAKEITEDLLDRSRCPKRSNVRNYAEELIQGDIMLKITN